MHSCLLLSLQFCLLIPIPAVWTVLPDSLLCWGPEGLYLLQFFGLQISIRSQPNLQGITQSLHFVPFAGSAIAPSTVTAPSAQPVVLQCKTYWKIAFFRGYTCLAKLIRVAGKNYSGTKIWMALMQCKEKPGGFPKTLRFFNSQQTLYLQETTSKMHQIAIFSVSAI